MMTAILKITMVGIIVFLSNICISQVFEEMPVMEPEICYANCKIENEFQSIKKEFLLFIGNSNANNSAFLDTVLINEDEVLYPTTKIIEFKDEYGNLKQRMDTIRVDPQFVIVVTDSTKITEYSKKVFTINKLIVKGGFTGWIRIVCKSKMTWHLIKRIQRRLKILGFYNGKRNGRMDQETKTALSNFQKEKGLPKAGLTKETLKELEIPYNWNE